MISLLARTPKRIFRYVIVMKLKGVSVAVNQYRV
jgi:hypothetical protein